MAFLTPIVGLADGTTTVREKGNASNTVRGSKIPARRPVMVSDNDQQNLELVHVYGRASFTYYIYDESGCPVMSGSGEFDDDGNFNIAIDMLSSGDYTIEVIINDSSNMCSFYKM